MMFQGWNGQRTRLVCDTGIIQVFFIILKLLLLHHSSAERERERGREGGRERPPTHPHFHQPTLRMEKAGNLEEFMDAEEKTDSECSSGCQSGWTLYLGRSQESFTTSLQLRTGDEEEDLSMLSDASSGPPLVHESNNCCCCCYNEREGCLCNDSFLTLTEVAGYRDKRRSFEEDKQKERSFSLEDTASSPLLSCYKATNTISCSRKKLDILEQSCSLSKSHFKGKIELQKQLGYLHSFCTCESSTGLQRR